MSKEMTTQNELMFDPKNLTKETIKKFLCPKASDQELTMGLQIAKTYNLNPLKREVYFVKYKEDQPMQVLTGYEVYLKRAQESSQWDGMELSSAGSVETYDLKGIVKVYRKDWRLPLVHEVDYLEYVQNKKDFATGKIEPNTFWKNKPKTMIKKVAVSQGFRMAFPKEFDGMPYTSDEVIDQDHIIDVPITHQDSSKISHEAQGSVILKDKDLSADEQLITKEQGEALMMCLAKNGYFMADLKKMISFEFELDSPVKIRNKHLPRIKEFFKDKKEVSK